MILVTLSTLLVINDCGVVASKVLIDQPHQAVRAGIFEVQATDLAQMANSQVHRP